MAKQTVNIGSTANDGTGDQLRTAFNKLNQNFDEVYGTNFVTQLMLNDNIVGAAELASSAVTTVKINNDAVTHDKLEDRYTALSTIASPSTPQDLNAGSFSAFNITGNLNSTQTLNITNMKTGQVIDILATGASTLTLTSDDTSESFNNLGAVVYDGTANNQIQIVCIDDTDSAAIYSYTISTYTADNTPN
tara:strand:- start:1561 stop:2133 length:573 start_codon:yes stop_codon:yes gene_type:complete